MVPVHGPALHPLEIRPLGVLAEVYADTMQKGGVGKTTGTIQFASQLARRGKKVYVVDMDPQASLTLFFLKSRPQIADAPTMYNFIVERVPVTPVRISKNLSLLPANGDLAALEQIVPYLAHTKNKPNYALRDVLWPLRNQCDFILVDAPPQLGFLTKMVMAAVTAPTAGLLVPVQTEEMAVAQLPKLFATVKDVQTDQKAGNNPQLRVKYIIPTMFDSRIALHHTWLGAMQDKYQHLMYPEPVYRRSAYEKSIDEGTDVVYIEPSLSQFWEKLTDACFFGPFPEPEVGK
jgi:chromosome partitioning protein